MGDQWFRHSDYRRLAVLSMGKAAAAMAWELYSILGGRVTDSLVITKEEHALEQLPWPQVEAGHPVPNEASVHAGLRVKELVGSLGAEDLLLVLLSGGASALVADLPPNCSLEEIQHFYQQLLASGASIDEMNILRKHFSSIKGGQLAKLAGGASIHIGVLSDVPGDDLSTIASGPFYPDSSTLADVERVLHKYELRDDLPPALADHLLEMLEDPRKETPKPGDPVFDKVRHHLLATNQLALQAAANAALDHQLEPIVFQSLLEGEARDLARRFLRQCLDEMEKRTAKGNLAPVCFLAGGETTVTLKGSGKGGRNQEFVLSILTDILADSTLAERLNRYAFAILSGGTDGTDGPTDAAGAVLDNRLLNEIREKGPDPIPYFDNQDAYHFFGQAGGLVKTGPTQTNVMDLVVIAMGPHT